MDRKVALIEILEPDGRVQHVVPVERWPVTLGRSLDCDVVLHDPHVAALHATLDVVDAGLRLTVGQSINGARLRGHTLSAGQSAVVPEGTVWTLGHSALRVRRPGEALPPEEPLAHPQRVRRASLTAGGVVLMLAWVTALLWLDNDPGARWDDYLPVLLGSVSGAALWCAMWGLGSKLFQRRFTFMPHLRVLLSFTMAGLVVDAALALASYAFAMPVLSHLRPWVAMGLGAALMASHARLLLPGRGRAIGLAFTALCALGITVDVALNWRRGGRVFDELYATALPPPAMRLTAARPPAALIDQVRTLKPVLDRHAIETESARDDDRSDSEE
jgi:hypothetical protein